MLGGHRPQLPIVPPIVLSKLQSVFDLRTTSWDVLLFVIPGVLIPTLPSMASTPVFSSLP
eukprot:9350667-Heterocapsa_arctica.AAC.1